MHDTWVMHQDFDGRRNKTYRKVIFISMGNEDVDDDVKETTKSDETEWNDESYPIEAKPQLSSETEELSHRQAIGQSLNHVMDWAHQNKIAVRYGVLTTISLLTVYGISQTPLFFRYRSVHEMPSRLFQHQKFIHGRIIDASDDLTLQIRHLSPMERLLSRHMFQRWQKWSPQRRDHGLSFQLVGIDKPPLSQTNTIVSKLVQEETRVKIQLIGRKLLPDKGDELDGHSTSRSIAKRPNPEYQEVHEEDQFVQHQSALAHIYYRPPRTGWQSIFRVNLAQELVRHGQALAAQEMYKGKVVHMQEAPKKMIRHMEDLHTAQVEAAKEYQGVWAHLEVREMFPDVTKEAEFQATAPWYRKMWRQWTS